MKWRWALLLAAAASLQLQAEAAAEQGALTHTHAHAHARSALRAPRPDQYLLISSPREQKVCFSRIHPGNSAGTAVKPLVDSGLMAPEGIAVDRKRGKMYVADPPVQKVFQYSIEVRGGELLSDNRQIPIVEGLEVHWLAVDQLGDLYFTGSVDNSVMTIPLDTLKRLESGELTSANMKTESEAAEAAAKAASANAALEAEGKPTPPPSLDETIRVLYKKGDDEAGVSDPAGIAADGLHIFWGNGAAGTSVGAIVEGARDVTNGEGPRQVSSNTNKVFGVATSSNAIFYSDNTQFVYGLKKAGGEVVTLSDSFQQPRGLAWDGDGTVFVADQAGSMVYSFPSGRLAPAHTARVTQLHDAFGLALVSLDDPFALAHAAVLAGAALLLSLV